MKHVAIRKSYSFFITDSEEIEEGAFDEKIEKLNEEIGILLEKNGLSMSENILTYWGVEKYAISNCEQCKQLLINRDKNPPGFDENDMAIDARNVIVNGGMSEGKLLCEDCLPITHRWGLHS